MSQGEQAGEAVKGVFKGIGDAGESIRQNINSFADELASSGSGTTASSASNHSSTSTTSSTGLTAHDTLGHGTSDRSGLSNSTTASGDVHPDAKALGNELEHGVKAAGAKFDEWKSKQ